ncbi:MAG: amino-acid N-acetyltransferase [Burkholderiales bacterium]|nr:MAG: amino-acid N-acetyltransferase [Burkholderiales bacterium]
MRDEEAMAVNYNRVMLEPIEQARFVTWLRLVAPYIHAFRGRTFVVGFAGELVLAGRLGGLVQDLSLLNALGVRIVVVYGSRPQIEEQMRLRGGAGRYEAGLRVTDALALECAKEAAGEMRLDVEALFSQGLPNTPMAHASVRVVSGNFVTARPYGVVDGVDFQHTGVVRKIDAQTIRFALNSGAVVLLPPLGFSPTGEAFNLTMEDVAASTAIALDADKLVMVTEIPGIVDGHGALLREIGERDARDMLVRGALDADTALYLSESLRACEGGVSRAHIVPFAVEGSVLLELFLHQGIGTMLVEETLESLREATVEDVTGILAILTPLEADGTLVKRDRALIEREISNFTVIEHDGVIFGCAALYRYPEDGTGELACLAVSPSVQGRGDGERILQRIEQRARIAGLRRLFVLTTRAGHWFMKRGFVLAGVEALPSERQNLYNWQRKSQIYLKEL